MHVPTGGPEGPPPPREGVDRAGTVRRGGTGTGPAGGPTKRGWSGPAGPLAGLGRATEPMDGRRSTARSGAEARRAGAERPASGPAGRRGRAAPHQRGPRRGPEGRGGLPAGPLPTRPVAAEAWGPAGGGRMPPPPRAAGPPPYGGRGGDKTAGAGMEAGDHRFCLYEARVAGTRASRPAMVRWRSSGGDRAPSGPSSVMHRWPIVVPSSQAASGPTSVSGSAAVRHG